MFGFRCFVVDDWACALISTPHRLKPIFYGLAYTPYNALEPWCGATLNNVTQDIILMSQLTSESLRFAVSASCVGA